MRVLHPSKYRYCLDNNSQETTSQSYKPCMPKITIIRPNEWVNQARHINIFIDGEKAGRIGSGQTAHFELSKGKHEVVLRNKWCGGSKPIAIDLSNSERRVFEISSNQYTFLIVPFLYIIASILYHVAVSILALNPSLMYDLLGIALVFLSLFIPFYNRHYMQLKEVEPDAFKKTAKKKREPLISKAMECEENDV